jgi:type II secretory pathway component PulC
VSLFDRFQDLVHDGPRWARPQVVVSALLVVALLAQVGTVAWPVLRHKLDARTAQGAGAPVASRPAITLRPGLSVATIIAGHLFGAPEPVAGPPVQTVVPLELMGTFAGADPTSGMAFVREKGGGLQHVYRVGEELPQGAVLRQVYLRRIVFERDGKLEVLSFPESTLRFAARPSLGALAYNPVGDDSGVDRTPEEQAAIAHDAATGPQWQPVPDPPGGSGAAIQTEAHFDQPP